MSKNRTRVKTRSLHSYSSEGIPRRSMRKKITSVIKSQTITKKPSDSFGLPVELIRSPVHGFYRLYHPSLRK